jgi:nucleoside-diphosphate-sugar epimerase
MSAILVTDAAGCIGFHVARRLLDDGATVVGADCFSPYYDSGLKEARFSELTRSERFTGLRVDLSDAAATRALFSEHRPRRVVHLAAQSGVRRALTDPHAYVASNVVAFLNLLEGCRHATVEHLIERPLPPGDVPETRADITDLRRDFGFAPSTPLQDGIPHFVAWYRGYHAVSDAAV